jgi:hypothetical protein
VISIDGSTGEVIEGAGDRDPKLSGDFARS